jgi:sugar/nucleoside kinase (ribokinase family)
VGDRGDAAQLRRGVHGGTRRGLRDAARDAGYGQRLTRIAVIGNLAVDHVGDAPPRVGGAAYYGGAAAARLGADAVVITRCAESDRERCVVPLAALGAHVVWHPGETTTSFAFHYEDGHRVMEVRAVGDPWLPGDIEGWAAGALREAEWAHAGALLRTDFGAETLAALAGGGRRVLIDAQGLVRRPQLGPLARDAEVDRRLLSHLTALKLSESEAAVLAGGAEPEALRGLGVPEVLLTLGARGSLVVTERVAEEIAAEPVPPSVDPTGAGDAFCLAYVATRADGAHPVDAARRASAFVSELLADR